MLAVLGVEGYHRRDWFGVLACAGFALVNVVAGVGWWRVARWHSRNRRTGPR